MKGFLTIYKIVKGVPVRTLRTQKLSIKIAILPLGINYDSALIMHAMSEYNWYTDWIFQVSPCWEENIDAVDHKSPNSLSLPLPVRATVMQQSSCNITK